jgi:hypothetical protein
MHALREGVQGASSVLSEDFVVLGEGSAALSEGLCEFDVVSEGCGNFK